MTRYPLRVTISSRPVPDAAYRHFQPVDLTRVDEILEDVDYDPKRMLEILEGIQGAYGYLPVAALKRISQKTGAWYAMIYGTATYYGHLRFESAEDTVQAAAVDRNRPPEASYVASLGASLAGVPRGAPPAA